MANKRNAAIGFIFFTILIDVIGFDWNCPQHITPRFTEAEIQRGTQPLLEELARLRARITELEGMIP